MQTFRQAFKKSNSGRIARVASALGMAFMLQVAEVPSVQAQTSDNPFAGINYGGGAVRRTRLDNPSVWQSHGVRAPMEVAYAGNQPAGSIVLDHKNQFLYLVLPNNKALEFVVAVGRRGTTITGQNHSVSKKVVDPEWYTQTSSGYTVSYGPASPLGPLALFLENAQGVDEGFAIHGTNKPQLLASPDGQRTFSHGCTRMHNNHIKILFERVQAGARVYIYYNNEVAPLVRRDGKQSRLDMPGSAFLPG